MERPLIATFFMENFDQKALDSIPKKPKFRFHYVGVGDTFVIWRHGGEELQIFVSYLNNKI